ncbi:MAG: hypothetical protein A4S17_12450 [Proteobacteria bacterium HN_bin10]|nr:MAG: hypothetical protein A4S17_12450 [Proteobacteria bacterium HN_bin10]
MTGFTSLIHQFGRLNEALMPITIVGLNPLRAWRIVPLGIKMLLKGKVPNPLGAPFTGIRQIRSIFHTARRRTAHL